MKIERKQLLILLLLLLPILCKAQHRMISGKVVDEATNEPLEFVTLFATNTTLGTTTDEKGKFSLSLAPGKHEIVVTMVGYGPIIYPVEISATSEKSPASILFKLSQMETALKTVSVKAKRDPSWYDNLEIFKTHFLGRSEVASKCILTNPESLIIVFDEAKRNLKVESNDLLIIENPQLGYKLSYLLVDFTFDFVRNHVSYLGYTRFEPMKGNKSKEKRWTKNRLRAYNGSSMHFVRALRQKQLEEEGFNLRLLIRIPNPNRPTEEQIQDARKQLVAMGPNSRLPDSHPLNAILSKTGLPKILEKLDTAHVPYKTYISEQAHEIRLSFDGYFQIVYAREKEELGYALFSSPFQKRKPAYQTSVISMKGNPVILEKSGTVSDPLALVFEGYWGWEKVGDILPLDYEPNQR
jgi:hypothetical protein